MSEHSELGALASKTNYGRKVPDFCGRLYTDDQPNGAAGTWVRRAEVDALLDEIAMLRRRLETRELNDLVQKHCSDETSEQPTPAAVLQWAVDSFGPIASNRDERAARLAEEAMEVAQAEGVPLLTLQKIAERIYSRPVGELGQEVGGLGITLYALAANCGLDLFGEINREWKRVLSKPRDWWQRKHAEKVAAGTADLSPTPKASEHLYVPVSSGNDRCSVCGQPKGQCSALSEGEDRGS